MRVAFYNHTSAVSGAEISLLLTASHLKTAEPVLFAPEGDLLDRARERGLDVVPVPGYSARLSRHPVRLARDALGMLRTGFRFALAVRKREVDLIHANSIRAGMMASLFRWLHRRPVVWHVRDLPPGGWPGRGIRLLAALGSQAVIGISRPVLAGMRSRRLEGRCHLVHNGVELHDCSEFERRRLRHRLRSEFGTPPSAKVIAVIGQIAPWKRQEDALAALSMLLEMGHDVYLWVVGEAKFREENRRYEEMLRKKASGGKLRDRVRFAGFRKDVMEICCAADLLFLCSDNEPFGRVLIEAMSQSVAVVATNAGGVPEIVEDGVSGLLYEAGDLQTLVRHADLLLREEETRRRLGRQGALRVRECFTIGMAAAKVEDVYRTVLRRPAGAAFPAVKEREFG
jgi:glycosyltransferase involved in cell wall biosynthesis